MRIEPVERGDESGLSRKLNSLEVLLLVFVSHGQSSTYDLMTHAGMSPGLTGPALKRMKAASLLSSTGSRKVVRYAITKTGERILHDSLRSVGIGSWWLEANTFYESWPRSLFLIWLARGFHEAEGWFERAEEQIEVLRNKKQNEAKDLEGEFLRIKKRFMEDPSSYDKGFILAHAYRTMKVASERLCEV
jgi:DNA-binding PadR family transcriptional regulator